MNLPSEILYLIFKYCNRQTIFNYCSTSKNNLCYLEYILENHYINVNKLPEKYYDLCKKINDVKYIKILPKNMTHIIFNDDFNQPVTELGKCNNLTNITFGNYSVFNF